MTLHKIVSEFRKGMLGRRKSKGHCWMVCWPLHAYLSMMGHEVKLTEGLAMGEHHTWLTLSNGQIIDPTADQFIRPGYKMPKVYIGEKPTWYQSNQ